MCPDLKVFVSVLFRKKIGVSWLYWWLIHGFVVRRDLNQLSFIMIEKSLQEDVSNPNPTCNLFVECAIAVYCTRQADSKSQIPDCLKDPAAVFLRPLLRCGPVFFRRNCGQQGAVRCESIGSGQKQRNTQP